MSYQATLPLLPILSPGSRPDLTGTDEETAQCGSGVEYFDLQVRDVLTRSSAPGTPFAWAVNPYRGCELACTYCYARYTHGFLGFERWQDFEQKIFVKSGAAPALERKLRRAALHGEPIVFGTATDPYQPAERRHRVTRSLLEVFARMERLDGLEISIATKSPLVLRDLDLLTELDKRHSITVHVTITTVDPALARRIERRAPDPNDRLRTVRALADEGIATKISCLPVMPGINDREAVLRPLFELAREAGASDVMGGALFLRPAARARFFPWLAQEFPKLVTRYRRLYGRRDVLSEEETDRLLATFRRLRLEYGFPHHQPGRG